MKLVLLCAILTAVIYSAQHGWRHLRDPEVLLIQAELELNEGNKKQAKETLKTAERRINEMGCHRWDREVEILQSKLDRHRSGDS